MPKKRSWKKKRSGGKKATRARLKQRLTSIDAEIERAVELRACANSRFFVRYGHPVLAEPPQDGPHLPKGVGQGTLSELLRVATAKALSDPAKLTAYLTRRREIEELLWLGRYEDLGAQLDIFDTQFGWTLWGELCRVTLAGLKDGAESALATAEQASETVENSAMPSAILLLSGMVFHPEVRPDAFRQYLLGAAAGTQKASSRQRS